MIFANVEKAADIKDYLRDPVIFERLAGHLHGKEFYPARHGIVEMLVKIHGFRGCEMRFFLDYTVVIVDTRYHSTFRSADILHVFIDYVLKEISGGRFAFSPGYPYDSKILPHFIVVEIGDKNHGFSYIAYDNIGRIQIHVIVFRFAYISESSLIKRILKVFSLKMRAFAYKQRIVSDVL